jgi:hypothetical protein
MIAIRLSTGLAALFVAMTAMAQTTVSEIPETALSLYIKEQCASLSGGGRCSVSFVQVSTGTLPSGNVQQQCAPGWLAHVMAERGTVEKGGVNRGQAVVCGHEQPEQAIRALLLACDQQTFGICGDASYVDIKWGHWSGEGAALTKLPMDQSLPIEQLPEAQFCESVVPLEESDRCPPLAAVTLRNTGLR